MTRDEQILAAAEKLFFERSFDGIGVDEIGNVAGTSGSAIYRHFPSKDSILAALFDKVLDTLLTRIGEPDDDPKADPRAAGPRIRQPGQEPPATSVDLVARAAVAGRTVSARPRPQAPPGH